jgi:hypothetical protein
MKAQSGPDYPEMAREAVTAALRDAGLPYTAVEAVVAGYCYGEPTCGTCTLPRPTSQPSNHRASCAPVQRVPQRRRSPTHTHTRAAHVRCLVVAGGGWWGGAWVVWRGAVRPGQRAVYEMGLTGVPVVNVNNNCSTGSTALFVAR